MVIFFMEFDNEVIFRLSNKMLFSLLSEFYVLFLKGEIV